MTIVNQKVAVITGASQGMGAALVQAYRKQVGPSLPTPARSRNPMTPASSPSPVTSPIRPPPAR
jgi:NADP-dependent 3-hydroxy acid dehydrogenase YdfG